MHMHLIQKYSNCNLVVVEPLNQLYAFFRMDPLYQDFYRLDFKTSKSYKICMNKNFEITKDIPELELKCGAIIVRVDSRLVIRKGAASCIKYITTKQTGTLMSFDVIPNPPTGLKANTLSNVPEPQVFKVQCSCQAIILKEGIHSCHGESSSSAKEQKVKDVDETESENKKSDDITDMDNNTPSTQSQITGLENTVKDFMNQVNQQLTSIKERQAMKHGLSSKCNTESKGIATDAQGDKSATKYDNTKINEEESSNGTTKMNDPENESLAKDDGDHGMPSSPRVSISNPPSPKAKRTIDDQYFHSGSSKDSSLDPKATKPPGLTPPPSTSGPKYQESSSSKTKTSIDGNPQTINGTSMDPSMKSKPSGSCSTFQSESRTKFKGFDQEEQVSLLTNGPMNEEHLQMIRSNNQEYLTNSERSNLLQSNLRDICNMIVENGEVNPNDNHIVLPDSIWAKIVEKAQEYDTYSMDFSILRPFREKFGPFSSKPIGRDKDAEDLYDLYNFSKTHDVLSSSKDGSCLFGR